ncbi:MAG: glycosyltransferase family 4 protein [Pikeienuella sp.]
MNRRIAFYAPMKSPDHPNPSGDRRTARLILKALDRGGWDAFLASKLRAHQRDGNAAGQDYLFVEAERLKDLLIREHEANPPALWFTYHCYYKAPDLIGPDVAKALGIPYVVAEGYRAKKRLTGNYARFAEAAESALDYADVIFNLTERGRIALEKYQTKDQKLVQLKPFTALGDEPAAKDPTGPLKLLTVAMMRDGDKSTSYGVFAEALKAVPGDWTLDVIGDGTARAKIERMFAPFGDRVNFRGLIHSRDEMRAAYEAADLFVWPGVNEAFGMVYLEAQAAGTPCIAQNRDGVREVIGPMGRLTHPDEPAALGAAIKYISADRAKLATLGVQAREYVKASHGVNAASATLTKALEDLL